MEETFDLCNKDAIFALFKFKRIEKADKYLKVLGNLLAKAFPNQKPDELYLKKVFGENYLPIYKLVKDMFIFFLEKYKFEYTEE